MSPADLDILLRSRKASRVVLVGDQHQAIYGFVSIDLSLRFPPFSQLDRLHSSTGSKAAEIRGSTLSPIQSSP